MRTRWLLVPLVLTLSGCPAPPPPPPPAAPEPTPPPTAKPTAKPAAKPEPPKQSKPPVLTDIELPAPPTLLQPAAKALAGKDWQGTVTALDAAKKELAKASVDERLQGLAMRGLALHMTKDHEGALRAYHKVLNQFEGAKKKLEQQIGKRDEASFNKRVAQMNHAFAAALFYLAEDRRAKAAAMSLPAYEGAADPAKVDKYFHGKVAQWLRRRDGAIGKASKAYGKLSSLKPPPSAWLVAAAAREAMMRAAMRDALAAAKAPDDWTKAPAKPAAPPPAASAAASASAMPASSAAAAGNQAHAALDKYRAAQGEALGDLTTKAREAFQRCADLANEQKRQGAFAKYCQAWLTNAK